MSRKITIAIVDDHTIFRKSLKVLIELFQGFQVKFDSAHGKDFIEQLDVNCLPDIVLMDIFMPIMDGYNTTEWLRSNFPEVRVIALSTMDSEAAIIKMIKCGAKGYLLKDVDSEELNLAINQVMSNGYFYNEKNIKKVIKSIGEIYDSKNDTKVFANLSSREVQFLKLACSELTYKEIAERLFVSVRTVEGYREALCQKLNLKTRVGLAMYAIRNNIASA